MVISKKVLLPVLLILAFAGFFIGGAYYQKQTTPIQFCQPSEINFSLFWEAYAQLKSKFVDPSKITEENVLYGAISGMAQSVKDPYTVFFNPTDAKKFEDELAGYFDGIGAEIGIKNGQLIVVSPLKNTPAEAAGLRAGDRILKIGDKDTVDMPADEAVTLIRGPKGSQVVLSITREGWTAPKSFTITRETIKVPSLEMTIKGDVANIKIYQFSQSLTYDFQQAAMQIINSTAEKIILDLRNNPGGYLEVSQQIAGWFLPKDEIVVIEDFGSGREQKVYKTEGNGSLSEYPIVVLINEGTASASEILAGALRDIREVKLVGVKSYGKGSVQEGITLQDGSFIKITIAKWLTPKGNSISEKGLLPDFKVAFTENDYTLKKDPQLEKALEIINNIQ